MDDEALRERAAARIGAVLCGKYRIDAILGIGGMAVVYAATHRNQKRVAIKVLHPEVSLRSDVRARFLREGYAANSVDHPGAVAVLDDNTAEDGSVFLVMDRLEGEEVDRLAARHGGRLAARAVLAIAEPLLAVLEAAHAKGIVHRDVKPANLFVTRDGTLKVLDFGIARVRDALSEDQHGTQAGMLVGTPAFMAPEQALGKSSDVDETSDVWAVGATLFSLLTGSQVHEGETTTALLVRAATQPARSLAVALPGADARLVALVDRALAFDKAGRWPSAAAMRAAVRETYLALFGAPVSKEPLEALAGEVNELGATALAHSDAPSSSAPSHGSSTAVRAARARRTKLLAIVAGAGVIALGAGLAGALLARAPDGEPTAAASGDAMTSSSLADGAASATRWAEPSSSATPRADASDDDDDDDDDPEPDAPAAARVTNAATRSSPAPTTPPPATSSAVTPHAPAHPPVVCKRQCVETARACKRQCKQSLRRGPGRHQCMVDCASVEKGCRGRAPC